MKTGPSQDESGRIVYAITSPSLLRLLRLSLLPQRWAFKRGSFGNLKAIGGRKLLTLSGETPKNQFRSLAPFLMASWRCSHFCARLAVSLLSNTSDPAFFTRMGSFLKTLSASGRPPTQLNLANTEFANGNWQNVVLKGVNLENAEIAWTNLEGAQLEVTDFNGLYPYGTAWWEAKSINKELLEYLKNSYPLQVGRSYGPRFELKTQEDYNAAVRRLTSQAK